MAFVTSNAILILLKQTKLAYLQYCLGNEIDSTTLLLSGKGTVIPGTNLE